MWLRKQIVIGRTASPSLRKNSMTMLFRLGAQHDIFCILCSLTRLPRSTTFLRVRHNVIKFNVRLEAQNKSKCNTWCFVNVDRRAGLNSGIRAEKLLSSRFTARQVTSWQNATPFKTQQLLLLLFPTTFCGGKFPTMS